MTFSFRCTRAYTQRKPSQIEIDSIALLRDVEVLASDSMAGRKTNTAGSQKARSYLVRRMQENGLLPWNQQFAFPFTAGKITGVNLVGHLKGTDPRAGWFVLTAHYDHLGLEHGKLHPGADDNASGVAAILEMCNYFRKNPPKHSMLFVFFDAEEIGLVGSKEFVKQSPIPLSNIQLNVNLDMVSRNESNELYLCGSKYNPLLSEILDTMTTVSKVQLRFGHDSKFQEDWTNSSDHASFHHKGIPFVYFGVEDHADYHSPRDTYQNIEPAFFAESVRLMIESVQILDKTFVRKSKGYDK